mgnify:FL=1|jgi:hypothetical protein
MRVIVDNLGIFTVTTNFGEKGFVFSKNNNMPIKGVLRAKMAGFVRLYGLDNPFIIGG